jgi:hypothetical protein
MAPPNPAEDRVLKLRDRTAWVVAFPAPDVPGEWLAHCLEPDVMSQGRTLRHALEMLKEAVDLVLREDFGAGLDPFDRKAPAADWQDFTSHVQLSRFETLDQLYAEADAGDLEWMAAQLGIKLVVEEERPSVQALAGAIGQHASAAA